MIAPAQYRHDAHQALRRTREQNDAIVMLLGPLAACPDFYTDVPLGSAPVDFGVVGGPAWRVDPDGTTRRLQR